MPVRVHVIGAGVVGLFAARELALRGVEVVVLESRRIGMGASGAAVGVLQVPGGSRSAFAALSREGFEIHSRVAGEIEQESGLAFGYRRCGSVRLVERLAKDPDREIARWAEVGVRATWCERQRLEELIPGYGAEASFGLEIDREAVLCPGSLLQALVASCRARGVRIVEDVGETRVVPAGHGGVRVESRGVGGRLPDARVLVTSGSWSEIVTADLPARPVSITPVRGQAIELAVEPPRCVVHFTLGFSGKAYYLVPREDGHVWVGSTVEEVGFDDTTTSQGRAELLVAARQVLPTVEPGDVVRHWAGLRPKAMRRGGPFVGRWPGVEDLWIAAGHYRSGVSQAPATARIVADAMLDGASIDPSFALLREDEG